MIVSMKKIKYVAFFIILILMSPAYSQTDYPSRPITLIVPRPPGGTLNLMSRSVADKMSKILGQPIVTENRDMGGSGVVTTKTIIKGPPDGYTILLGYTSTLATGPNLLSDAGYDVRKDLTPIGAIGVAPGLLLVHPSIPYQNVADLITHAKTSKEPFQIATPGISTITHFTAMLFAQKAGIQFQYIPYKGSQAVTTDLIGSHVKIGFNPIPASYGAVEGKLLRALASTSIKRSGILPNLPTIAETLPDFDAVLTYGLIAPAGTPNLIIQKLNSALRISLATDEVKNILYQEGAEPLLTTSEEYASIIDKEETKWSSLIKFR
jgi:tripartite-type tricarboxylate transporter receptor subunit TctC